MRIAAIADIHGNLPALEAVLHDIEGCHVDEIVVVGDAVNGGPFPQEVLHAIQDHGWARVRGNHEQYVLDCCGSSAAAKQFDSPLWRGVHWTRAQLSAADIAEIETWPISLVRGNIFFVHGSPLDLRGGIIPTTPETVIEDAFGAVLQPYVVTAHTHIPFIRHWRDQVLINPGAVGMPLDDNPAASYCILSNEGQGVAVQFRRVYYDTMAVARAAHERGLLAVGGYPAKILLAETLTGRKLIVDFLKRMRHLMENGQDMENALAQAYSEIDLEGLPLE